MIHEIKGTDSDKPLINISFGNNLIKENDLDSEHESHFPDPFYYLIDVNIFESFIKKGFSYSTISKNTNNEYKDNQKEEEKKNTTNKGSEKLFPFSQNFQEYNSKELEISFFDRDLNYSIPSIKGNDNNNQLNGEEKECNESKKLFPYSHNFEEDNSKESELSFFDRNLNYSTASKKGNDDNKQLKEEEKEYKIKTDSIYFNHFSKQNISLEGFNHFKLFNIQSIEKRKKVKRNVLERKEENSEFLKRKRKNKEKPGRKTNCIKPKYSHTSLDFDNLQVKINNHFLNFLINLSNDIISCELGKNTYHKFKNIDRAFKINVKFDHLRYIKKKPIKYLLSLDINNKYTKLEKYYNRIVLENICEQSEWMKNVFFEINYLEFFNYYYKSDIKESIGAPAKMNIKGKDIFLSSYTKPFSDLINKNKEIENLLINTVKSTYFDGKDGVEENIKFTTLKN